MIKLLVSWVLHALALVAVAHLVPGIHVAHFSDALWAALVIGLANTLIRPLLILLTLPITLLTLGLFIFIINGVLFYLAGDWIVGFSVATLTAGVVGALVYSVLSWLLISLFSSKE